VGLQIIGPVLPLHTGTESLQTRRWREMDSNPRSPVKDHLEVVVRALDHTHGWIEPR
jgi:hypothetical protein